jgi:hypothetical protein
MPIHCKWIESSLNSYIDGELNPAKRMLVSRHLKKCAQCKSAACELIRAKAAVKDRQAGIETPAYLREAIAHKIAARSQGRFGWRGKTIFSPEFSWGVATVSILVALVGYLVFIKPDVSACNLITTIQPNIDGGGRPPVSEVSSALNYFGKGDGSLLETVSVTVQNNDCKGGDSLILHMTIKKGNEILVYTHGGSADIKSIEGAGALLKKTNIEGKDFYVGDFVGVKIVCWNMSGDKNKRPYAMAIKEA